MASTYQALTREIEALKKKADIARKHEAAELVALIKSGIEMYGLTAQDLGLESTAKRAVTPSNAKTAASAGAVSAAKYADGAGHSWSGRGPRPGWVNAAIDAGQTLDDLLASPTPKSAPLAKSAGKTAKSATKKAAKPAKKASVQPSMPASTTKYKDDAGNTWSGRGPKPGWLRAAIEAGKALEDFLA